MRPITFLVAVLAVTPFISVTARQRLPVELGDRVRITAPDLGINKYTGVLWAVDHDTLAMGTLHVAVASVTRLEVSREWKRHTEEGVIIGLIVGLIAGSFIGGVTYEPPPPPPCEGWFCGPDIDLGLVPRMFISAGIGAGIGAVAGALVGFAIKTEQWEEAPLDRLRVSFAPQRDGRFAFRLSAAF